MWCNIGDFIICFNHIKLVTRWMELKYIFRRRYFEEGL